jgi:hypothetical protein
MAPEAKLVQYKVLKNIQKDRKILGPGTLVEMERDKALEEGKYVELAKKTV